MSVVKISCALWRQDLPSESGSGELAFYNLSYRELLASGCTSPVCRRCWVVLESVAPFLIREHFGEG